MSGFRICMMFLLAAELFGGFAVQGAEPSTNKLVELKGRVTPLNGSTNLQFKVEGGPTYKLLPSRDARALFEDPALRSKTLLLKGKVHPDQPGFEVIGILHSVKNGKLYELYYYCDICSIETSFPGLCLCCREPVVLHEREEK